MWGIGNRESGVGNRESEPTPNPSQEGNGNRELGIGNQESGIGNRESGRRIEANSMIKAMQRPSLVIRLHHLRSPSS
ncbi:hypothetical protein [Moorena sp. SIO3A2]|uniref:hypothetical protein n=1 Tax=Moorena sp. SIO3A2 TaxID=2607841 RepID=UPI00257ED086|nr:hypothetical protein [Moorena sp. SIO3A2]